MLCTCSLFQDIKKKTRGLNAALVFIFVSQKHITLQTMNYDEYDFQTIVRQRDKMSNGECNNLCLDQLKQRQRQRKEKEKDKEKKKDKDKEKKKDKDKYTRCQKVNVITFASTSSSVLW